MLIGYNIEWLTKDWEDDSRISSRATTRRRRGNLAQQQVETCRPTGGYCAPPTKPRKEAAPKLPRIPRVSSKSHPYRFPIAASLSGRTAETRPVIA